MVMPVKSPMAPAPSKATEEANSKTNSEREVRASIPNSGIRIPARPGHNWTAVHQPRIIGGDINDIGLRRLNDYRRALRSHGLLRGALQIAGGFRFLAHYLNRVHHFLLLVVVGVP